LLADAEHLTADPLIPVVNGSLDVLHWYRPADNFAYKRKKCARFIRSMSTMKLPNLFVDQAALYRQAQEQHRLEQQQQSSSSIVHQAWTEPSPAKQVDNVKPVVISQNLTISTNQRGWCGTSCGRHWS